MSEKENDKGFRVIDRRGKEEASSEPEKKAEGEGFVMGEKPEEASPSPGDMDFSTLVFSLATGAFIHLGLSPDPQTQKVEKNLPLAKQNIEILGLLEEKTKGNLSEDEGKLLESLLAETRLRYVEASR